MPVTPIIGAVAGGLIANKGAKSAQKAANQQTQAGIDASLTATREGIAASERGQNQANAVYAYDNNLGQQVDPLLSGAMGLGDQAQRDAYEQSFRNSAFYGDVGNAVNETARIAESNAAAQGRANVRGNGQTLNALNANIWQIYNNARQQHLTTLGARADQGANARTGMANAFLNTGNVAANAWAQNGQTRASLYNANANRLQEIKTGQYNALAGYAGQAIGGLGKLFGGGGGSLPAFLG